MVSALTSIDNLYLRGMNTNLTPVYNVLHSSATANNTKIQYAEPATASPQAMTRVLIVSKNVLIRHFIQETSMWRRSTESALNLHSWDHTAWNSCHRLAELPICSECSSIQFIDKWQNYTEYERSLTSVHICAFSQPPTRALNQLTNQPTPLSREQHKDLRSYKKIPSQTNKKNICLCHHSPFLAESFYVFSM